MLLETLREYGARKLIDAGEECAARSRHLEYYLQVALQAEPELQGRQPQEALDRLEAEYENLRAAIEWATQTGRAETGLRLAGAVWRFWMIRGYIAEGQERLTRLLALPGAETPITVRAKALHGAGRLAYHRGDYSTAEHLFAENLAVQQSLIGRTNSWGWLAHRTDLTGHPRRERALFEESLATQRELGLTDRIRECQERLAAVSAE